MSDLNPALQFQNRKRANKASDAANGSSVTGDTIDTKNYDIINSYNFILRVEGFQNLPLKAVRGINKQNEYEYIQEGGLNDYVHMVRKPISQPFTFQVERYVAQGWLKDAIDPLANGTELMLPLVLYMYRSNAHDGTAPSRYYIFTNCRVTGVQVGDLDAEKSGLHTITNTIAYAQMMIVTLPFLGIDDDGMYSFNKGNAENKENTSHVRTLKDMGYTKMTKLDPAKDKNPEETDADFARRNAAVDYRGTRSKEDMKSLSIKYKYEEKKPAKDEAGQKSEESNNKNTKQVVAQENNRKGDPGKPVKYKFKDSNGGNESGEAEGNNKNTDRVAVQKQTKAEVRKLNMADENSKSANTKNVEAGKDKSAMKNAAKKYNFKNKSNKSAAQDEFEISKTAMKAKAEMYNKLPHYAEQDNEAAEIRNEYKFGGKPSGNVQIPSEQVDKEEMEGKARKYPKTRSARDVSEFLGRK